MSILKTDKLNIYKHFFKLSALAFVLCSSVAFHSNAEEDLTLVVSGGETVTVNRSQKVISEIADFSADYIAEIQETISFNKGLTKSLGLEISNSRFIFPMSNGDFIVTDETAVEADFNLRILDFLRNRFSLALRFDGAARPSVKRFFISPALDRRADRDYVSLPGPSNTDVLHIYETGNFDIGGGVRLSPDAYARYNRWFERFSRNITSFPLSVELADAMALGEGYSFVFEGGASFGPSALYQLIEEGHFGITPSFRFQKVLKTGKFELIIYKHTRDKVLLSIRQVRTVGDSNFVTTWGAHAGPNLDVIIGSSLPDIAPDYFRLISFDRRRETSVEERFNSVFEVDLSNEMHRIIYDQTLSDFDFSLLEVFSMKDISTTSNILQAFRDSPIKLLLDMKTKVDVLERHQNFKFLTAKREWLRRRESFVDGTANFEDRSVDIAGGSITNRVSTRSRLFGDETTLFEFKAYEEYGEEAINLPSDIVLLARKTLYDDQTKHYRKSNGHASDRSELEDYVQSFNGFTQSTNAIRVNPTGTDWNLRTTQGNMEFYLTRDDIKAVGNYDPIDLKDQVIKMMIYESAVSGISNISIFKERQLYRQDPSDWTFTVRAEIKNAFRDFLLGHRMLNAAVNHNDVSQRAPLSANALAQMLNFPRLAESYARLFRYVIVRSGLIPKINISFSNSFLRVDFKETAFPEAQFEDRGFLVQENLNRALTGRSYYDNINGRYLRSVKKDGSKIEVKFKRLASDFRGFLKILIKRRTPGDATTYDRVAEFIVDLKDYNSRTYVFDTQGSTEAETFAAGLASGEDVRFFVALSFDNRAYDEEREALE